MSYRVRFVSRARTVALTLLSLTALALTSPQPSPAQAFAPDSSTLWLAHFDGTPVDARLDTALTATSLTWVTGRIGQAVSLTSPAQLRYARAGNVYGPAGTIEFWIRPAWAGGDSQNHTVIECGGAGGILVDKDAGNYLRIILNRYGAGGRPEIGISKNVAGWSAGTWHHVAFTWTASTLRMYIDGSQVNSGAPSSIPPALTNEDFTLGSQGSSAYCDGALDELRISWVARTAAEITTAAGGSTLIHDGSTLFLAHFDGDETGTPDSPNVSTGLSYEPGTLADAVRLTGTSDLRIGTANHLAGTLGTIEFWLKPGWNGGDGIPHTVLECGDAGGMLVGKDGGDYWRLIMNRYAPGGMPELGVGVYVGTSWVADAWHHCAFTWGADSLRCYIDGRLANAGANPIAPPALAASEFRVGRQSTGYPLEGALDELRISSTVRSSLEILEAFLAGASLTALIVPADTTYLLPGAYLVPAPRVVAGSDTLDLPPGLASWSSSDPGVVEAGSADTLWARGTGVATVTASFRGLTAEMPMAVRTPELLATPDTVHAWVTWPIAPVLRVVIGTDTTQAPAGAATWESSDLAVVEPGTGDTLWARGGGEATVTVRYLGASASLWVSVRAAVLEPTHEELPADLTTPAADAVWDVPVLIVRYLPTADGENLDTSTAPAYWELGEVSLADQDAAILAMNRRMKFALEQGSRFRAHRDALARPALGYHVVDQVTVYEQTPPGKVLAHDLGDPIWAPDWFAIFERLGVRHYIEDLGVKEVWVWAPKLGRFPSFDPAIHQLWDFRGGWESNMSSPVTGDISNSNRDGTDLPVYAHTYVVYDYNFRRTQAEAIHDHGHQIEAQLAHVDAVDNATADLFLDRFCGRDGEGNRVLGRCGDTHSPPNTLAEYDYENWDEVSSDIADWTPDGTGEWQNVNAGTWGDREYAWPDGVMDFPQRIETQWYVYWMQSIPGYANGLTYGSDYLTDWWDFIGDWDGAMSAGRGLQSSSPIADVAPGLPARPALALSLAGPNPARGPVAFGLRLGVRGALRVGVYDLLGRRVRSLWQGDASAGEHRITWDSRDEGGRAVAAGIYLVRAEGNDRSAVRRVCVLR